MGKGSNPRPRLVSYDTMAINYTTAFGSDFCCNCKKIQPVRTVETKDEVQVSCSVCNTFIESIYKNDIN